MTSQVWLTAALKDFHFSPPAFPTYMSKFNLRLRRKIKAKKKNPTEAIQQSCNPDTKYLQRKQLSHLDSLS
ncbi:hypothetical protein HanXRQr2_Chr10g0430551 [Helianthus annuus]|uniref:Uncharacterized protein n=1 Tax=Helianthus annuus TaxID=4232 RepID=A0A9K3HW22_HELAN|nr:hypothetical protein HanXRQr2_Chr10g0430551 [Helianthus annuus]